jgi:hypothetical protein
MCLSGRTGGELLIEVTRNTRSANCLSPNKKTDLYLSRYSCQCRTPAVHLLQQRSLVRLAISPIPEEITGTFCVAVLRSCLENHIFLKSLIPRLYTCTYAWGSICPSYCHQISVLAVLLQWLEWSVSSSMDTLTRSVHSRTLQAQCDSLFAPLAV